MSFYKTAKRVNRSLSLYKFAVSTVYDVLGTGRTIDTVSKSILEYLKKNPEINSIEFQLKFAKEAQDKFNKLIVPYLGTSPVNLDLNDLKNRLQKSVNQDDLQFFLHDLLHEILKPGSIGEFNKLDSKFEEIQSETLEEMKEDSSFSYRWEEDEEGEEIFTGEPRYELSHEVYSLEDYIEEQVAEALTNKDRITDNGLLRYFSGIFIGILNDEFGMNYSYREFEFDMVYGDVERFFDRIKDKAREDVNGIKNFKYKKIGQKFLQSFLGWMREVENQQKDADEFYPRMVFTNLRNKIKYWIGANFNIREKKFEWESKSGGDYKENPMGEKEINNLTDDLKMSLMRRWVLSLDLLAKEMMSNQFSE